MVNNPTSVSQRDRFSESTSCAAQSDDTWHTCYDDIIQSVMTHVRVRDDWYSLTI